MPPFMILRPVLYRMEGYWLLTEEERFTQVKHGKRPIPFSMYELPYHAIDYCLKTAGIHLKDIDHVAYSFGPYLLPGDCAG